MLEYKLKNRVEKRFSELYKHKNIEYIRMTILAILKNKSGYLVFK